MSSSHGEEDEGESQTMDLVRMLADLKADSKRRKETKRKQVEAEFKKKAQKINERMAEIKEAHDAKVEAVQKEQFDQLRHLLHQRQLEELAIWKSVRKIEAVRAALAKTLDEAYSQRLEMIAEINTTGKLSHEEKA